MSVVENAINLLAGRSKEDVLKDHISYYESTENVYIQFDNISKNMFPKYIKLCKRLQKILNQSKNHSPLSSSFNHSKRIKVWNFDSTTCFLKIKSGEVTEYKFKKMRKELEDIIYYTIYS